MNHISSRMGMKYDEMKCDEVKYDHAKKGWKLQVVMLSKPPI